MNRKHMLPWERRDLGALDTYLYNRDFARQAIYTELWDKWNGKGLHLGQIVYHGNVTA